MHEPITPKQSVPPSEVLDPRTGAQMRRQLPEIRILRRVLDTRIKEKCAFVPGPGTSTHHASPSETTLCRGSRACADACSDTCPDWYLPSLNKGLAPRSAWFAQPLAPLAITPTKAKKGRGKPASVN